MWYCGKCKSGIYDIVAICARGNTLYAVTKTDTPNTYSIVSRSPDGWKLVSRPTINIPYIAQYSGGSSFTNVVGIHADDSGRIFLLTKCSGYGGTIAPCEVKPDGTVVMFDGKIESKVVTNRYRAAGVDHTLPVMSTTYLVLSGWWGRGYTKYGGSLTTVTTIGNHIYMHGSNPVIYRANIDAMETAPTQPETVTNIANRRGRSSTVLGVNHTGDQYSTNPGLIVTRIPFGYTMAQSAYITCLINRDNVLEIGLSLHGNRSHSIVRSTDDGFPAGHTLSTSRIINDQTRAVTMYGGVFNGTHYIGMDSGRGMITILDKDGGHIKSFTPTYRVKLHEPVKISAPKGLCSTSDGNIYLLDGGSSARVSLTKRILTYNSNGKHLGAVVVPGL